MLLAGVGIGAALTTASLLIASLSLQAPPTGETAGPAPTFPIQSSLNDQYSPDDARLYVLRTIKLEQSPSRVVLDESAERAYVLQDDNSGGNGNVAVVDTRAAEVLKTIKVGEYLGDLAVDSAINRLLVTNYGAGAVSTINTSTQSTVKRLEIGDPDGPRAIAIDTATHHAYVAFYQGTVLILDTRTAKQIGSVDVGSTLNGIAVDSSTHRAYVTMWSSNKVAVLDSGKLVGKVQVGREPVGLAVDSPRGRVYVANSKDKSVSVIDLSVDEVTATVKVGKSPYDVAVDSRAGKVYVTNSDSGTLSVIGASSGRVEQTVKVGDLPMGVAVDAETHHVFIASLGQDALVEIGAQ